MTTPENAGGDAHVEQIGTGATIPAPAPPPTDLTPPGLRTVALYTPTWEETVDGYEELLRGDLDVRAETIAYRGSRLQRAAAISLIIGLLVLAIPTMLRRWIFPNPYVAAAIPAGLVMAYHLLMRPGLDGGVRSRARALAAGHARKKYWVLARPTQVGVCDAGLWINHDRAASLIRWRSLSRCSVGEAAVIVAAGRLDGFSIPLRAFPDLAAAQAFVAEVLAAQQRTGVHPDDEAAALLAGTNIQCPNCEYDLVGCQSRICPECGTAFDTEGEERRRAIG